MSWVKRIVLVCALLAVGAVWFYPRSESPEAVPAVAPSPAVTESTSVKSAPETVSQEAVADDPDCLTPAQLETHPILYEESVRFLPYFTSGPEFESYRGLGRNDVQTLAGQNDTAAMAVLGAMAMLRARGLSESDAVDYLTVSDKAVVRNKFWRASEEEDAKEEYQRAHDWFYKSAMHGRLFALQNAGEALEVIERSPIKRGLISQEEYDALSNKDKGFMNISSIYSAAASDVAGNPQDGLLGMLFAIMPRSEIMNELAANVAQEFRDDVRDAGLPPIQIPESTMPSLDEMRAMVCEEFHPKDDDE